MRIGQGYDVHKLVNDRKCIIGGVDIPFGKGLLGHSDADVLLHAISDALLGALALGDIGLHFPPDNPEYKDINSRILLKKANELIIKKGYKVVNIDATIIAEKPKMLTFIPKMRENISKDLNTDTENISIKATTEEGLGFTGREEGIAALAICLVEKI